MPLLKYSQLRYLSIILIAWLLVFLCTRSILLITHWDVTAPSLGQLLHLYAIGFLYDLGFLIYATIPLGLYISLCPRSIWSNRWHKRLLFCVLPVYFLSMLFIAISEWIFWDEFSVRFNFIAVDYLVYTDEVIDNIMESYPVYPILGALALLAIAISFAVRSITASALNAQQLPWSTGFKFMLAFTLLAGFETGILGQGLQGSMVGNTYQRELAGNGPYQFFASFRNNELKYSQFYATLPKDEVAKVIRQELTEENSHFIGTDPLDITREISNTGTVQNYNVVIVIIESLSSRFLGSFGDPRNLTPNLDVLRKQSLFFNNFYATGTRTTRGLEAITLSIPPTPGRSIVKRLGREGGFASLGQQFNSHGYDSVFLYGGRGYFDNMNAFFKGNGYRIVDQSSIPEEDIYFKNAWGMSDEDLYAQAIKVADADYATGKPFLLQLMTTSNHRPYTYPDGRIDIPSGEGRHGAIKYTDYAIGHFLEQAQKKDWFKETVFVFVADHTAGSAGHEDLPVAKYHIPLFIYAPGIVQAHESAILASQIDLAPTLLGLLNFSYTSSFYGHDLLKQNHGPDRILIGNYQHLGLFDGKDLAILSPRQMIRKHSDAMGKSIESISNSDDPLVTRDIAYYQGSSYAYSKGFLKWH